MTQGWPPKPRLLYAFQGTGNGHASRAQEILEHLKKWATVEVLCSGNHRQLQIDHQIDYHFKGISFVYNAKGGLDYLKTLQQNDFKTFIKNLRNLDLSGYDLIINDFEPVSAWAAYLNGKPCLAMGHQAAFLSEHSPRPRRKRFLAEWIFKYYAPANQAIGFHFKSYDRSIYPVVLRRKVVELKPQSGNQFLCYLPAYKDENIYKVLSKVTNRKWLIYSANCTEEVRESNCVFRPIDADSFLQELNQSAGLLCSAGFEAPAEALYLGKKLMVIPIKGQYEQSCNAAALADLGVPVLRELSLKNLPLIQHWIYDEQAIEIDHLNSLDEFLKKQLFPMLKKEVYRLEGKI